jgi:hypothetical protein
LIVAEQKPVVQPRSLPSARRQAIRALRDAGASRISDHFIVPATEGHPSPRSPTGSRQVVSWREQASEYWVRTADVPFDLLPLGPKAVERRATLFSLGPGLDHEGFEHPAVLLMQFEGTKQEVGAELHRLKPLISVLVTELRVATCQGREEGISRTCISGMVRCT